LVEGTEGGAARHARQLTFARIRAWWCEGSLEIATL
jgi:hypothetical protein